MYFFSKRLAFFSVVFFALLFPLAPDYSYALDAQPARDIASSSPRPALDPFFDDLEQRTFQFFWDTANPENGLVPDKAPANSASSIAAVGFGLTAYPIGVERGYITRDQARQRVLTTLRFFRYAPQGEQAEGITGYHGFFYHFLDMKTGQRTDRSELSTIDTALLLGGMLFCQSYFDGDDLQETEIRTLVDTIYRRVDWRWAATRPPAIALGWSPEQGFIPYDWVGYNEGMLIYLLALASPTHGLELDSWTAWTGTYDLNWGISYGQEFLNFPPLFGHQYSHVWIDFRDIQDAYMRGRGIDYFENSRRATIAQRNYAIDNPQMFKGYGKNVWGLTASDGPVDTFKVVLLRLRHFLGYSARGVGGIHIPDDGTIAPTAALASLPFAPEIVIPAAHEMFKRYGAQIYSKYGFIDAFNPSFDFDYTTMQLRSGKVVRGIGWVDSDYLGIDQGPILAMIENYRSEFVWRIMRKNAYLRRGLEHAGFSGGWLGPAAAIKQSNADANTTEKAN